MAMALEVMAGSQAEVAWCRGEEKVLVEGEVQLVSEWEEESRRRRQGEWAPGPAACQARNSGAEGDITQPAAVVSRKRSVIMVVEQAGD